MDRFIKVVHALVECFFIGYLLRFSLVFAFEARLADNLFNVVGDYMASGGLAICAVYFIGDSLMYKYFKERKRASLDSESDSDS